MGSAGGISVIMMKRESLSLEIVALLTGAHSINGIVSKAPEANITFCTAYWESVP